MYMGCPRGAEGAGLGETGLNSLGKGMFSIFSPKRTILGRVLGFGKKKKRKGGGAVEVPAAAAPAAPAGYMWNPQGQLVAIPPPVPAAPPPTALAPSYGPSSGGGNIIAPSGEIPTGEGVREESMFGGGMLLPTLIGGGVLLAVTLMNKGKGAAPRRRRRA